MFTFFVDSQQINVSLFVICSGGGGGGSNYGTLELPPGGHAPHDMVPQYDQQVPPQPPRDNNQMAAWYDTDL